MVIVESNIFMWVIMQPLLLHLALANGQEHLLIQYPNPQLCFYSDLVCWGLQG